MNTRTERGFTLWELMMAIAVAGVVLGLGIPNMIEFQRNNAMASASNELVTAVLLARAEAVKRQVPVSLCLSADPDAPTPTCSPAAVTDASNLGFVVWVDDDGTVDANGSPIVVPGVDGDGTIGAGELVLRRSPPPGGSIRLSADGGLVTYWTSGFPRPAIAGGRMFVFCDDRGNRPSGAFSSARAVRIDPTGRGQVLQDVAAVTAAVGTTGATCP